MEEAKVVGVAPWVIPQEERRVKTNKGSCLKVKFSTAQEAYAVIAAGKGRRKTRKESSVYYCERCKAFHTSSIKKGEHK
jgi:hypothetical protein